MRVGSVPLVLSALCQDEQPWSPPRAGVSVSLGASTPCHSEPEQAFQKVALSDLCQVQSVTPPRGCNSHTCLWKMRFVHGRHTCAHQFMCVRKCNPVTPRSRARVLCVHRTRNHSRVQAIKCSSPVVGKIYIPGTLEKWLHFQF